MGHSATGRSAGLVASFALGAAMLVLSAAPAAACAICLSGMKVTIGQKLDLSGAAVLAVPLAEPGSFRIVEVIKGKVDGNAITLSPPPAPAPTPGAKPLLMLRNQLSDRWESEGAIGSEYAPWLRQIVATDQAAPREDRRSLPFFRVRDSLTEAEWIERLAVVAVNLESPEPLAAEIAYGEISRAPYGTLHSLKPRLNAERIAAWMSDPQLASRRPGYTLLLGIAGGPDDAARLEQTIDLAWLARDATNLPAMLAADLELRGPGRVAWIEKQYFADPRRTLPEIEAALLALSVHGGASGTIPRARVVEAYRTFIEMRRPMAGFVAVELADWEAWEATPDYVDIVRSNAVKDPAGQFAILSYLKRSPVAAGQAGLLPPSGQTEQVAR